jgi:hypothetical protein
MSTGTMHEIDADGDILNVWGIDEILREDIHPGETDAGTCIVCPTCLLCDEVIEWALQDKVSICEDCYVDGIKYKVGNGG